MKYLGKRLRELRIKNDMSQEYVAKMIGVSNQAISKWETGKSDPEIGSLIPLADLFHVPVDELLDREKRRLDWEDRMTRVFADGDRNAQLQLLKDAVAEFPGDFKFRYLLACEEYHQAQEETEPEQRRELLVLAEDRFAALGREYPEFTVAVDMHVRTLVALDRRGEAEELARSSPNREQLLLCVLQGDELAVQRRKVITTSLLNLLAELMREGSPEALRMVESIVTDAAGQDGQLMDFLLGAYYRQALLRVEGGQPEEAAAVLEKGYQALASFKEQNDDGEQHDFLYPIMTRRTKKEAAAQFLGFLRDERFACLRELPGFQMVQTGVEKIAKES